MMGLGVIFVCVYSPWGFVCFCFSSNLEIFWPFLLQLYFLWSNTSFRFFGNSNSLLDHLILSHKLLNFSPAFFLFVFKFALFLFLSLHVQWSFLLQRQKRRIYRWRILYFRHCIFLLQSFYSPLFSIDFMSLLRFFNVPSSYPCCSFSLWPHL